MTSSMNGAVILSADDRIRMVRLYEEVVTRLEEMAMITGRSLKIEAERAAVQFRPLNSGSMAVEIINAGQHSACYDYREGICFARGRKPDC